MEFTFKLLLTIGGTLTTFLFGAWHVSLTILLVMMTMNYITGVMKGIYTGELRSNKGFKGILKKTAMLMAIIMANLLDVLLGNIAPVFRTVIIYYFISNEAISIIENLGEMGVNLPESIKEKFIQLKDVKDEKSPSKDEDKFLI